MESEAQPVALAQASRPAQPPALVWEWSAATLGAVYALPGAVVILSDRSRGLALVLGVLPAAIIASELARTIDAAVEEP